MAQPSTQDVVKFFDPTGMAAITGEALAQLVDGIYPYGDKGFVVLTTDVGGTPEVPDAHTNTKWQRYVWMRRMASSVKLYVWNPNGTDDAALHQWEEVGGGASIPDRSITAQKIVAGTITDNELSTISQSKISGLVSALNAAVSLNTAITSGDLAGVNSTYANPVITNGAVDYAKLKSDAAVDANRSVGADHIRDQVVGFTRHIKPDIGAGKIPKINSGGTAWEYVALPVLQFVAKKMTSASGSSSSPIAASTSLPDPDHGTSALTLAFVPLSGTSVVSVRFACTIWAATATTVSVMITDGTTVFQCHGSKVADTGGYGSVVVLDFVIQSWGAGVSKTFDVRFSANGAGVTSYLNHDYSSAGCSYLSIFELVGTVS